MTAAPVFIFAAGLRSGSTLLQRLITASREVLVWGEHGGALDRLAEALDRYRQQLGPDADRDSRGDKGGAQYERFRAAGASGEHLWIANMNPPERCILDGFRAFLETTYGAPARELGYGRWGVKEVRSGVETARFLRELYAEAKFVFLVRNPLDSLTSIKQRRWDRLKVRDPLGAYARQWARLAAGFRGFDAGHLLRYEDLVSGPEATRALADYLDLAIPEDFVGASRVDGWHATRTGGLTRLERFRIRLLAGRAMRDWRYS